MNIAWVPHIPQVLENKFFLEDGRDNSQKPYKELRNLLEAQGIHLNTIDMYSDLGEVDFVIFAYHNRMNIRYYCELLRRGELNKAIYMAYEPPIVEQIHERENLQQMNAFFPTVFTWNDSCVDGKQFRKMVYPQYISNEDIAWTPFSERKLLTCISGFKASSNDIDANDLYQERLRVIDFFQNNQTDFEHYGFGWDKNKYKNYKGTIDKKKDVYHKYRFALCLENMSGEPGYISEKINDCINCGVVPIYGGAPNIDKYVPKECFIDYFSFTSVAELHEYLLAMKEEEWLSYIEAGKKYKRDEMDKTFGITSLYEQLMVVFKQSKQPFSLSIKSKARLFAHITEYLFIAIRYRLKQVINRIKI